ncbi:MULTISPECIES: cysteine peptidase family C39 domain-containing protein [Acinetobacter]|jgi:hypothetical protein|uniref:cysteine peptidase family C39 domain-containing protein n=1 Tax=Acinetobacter TaxID=469 RepID=UPI000CFE446E|nr:MULTISPECIES: cysteine peptidase family C39 domain-containing protein [Acinetobacter]MDI1224343.1 cysteine peptidase family C39 domain-containing protein [Acinetobacter sp.]QLD61629.1 peptidase C39 [Acinetobacter sp. MYb10]
MSVQLPKALLDLESNCGIFAVWMLLQNYSIQLDIQQLVKLCHHDAEDGTFTIGLAVGLKKLGFDLSFYTDEDSNIHEKEIVRYQDAKKLGLQISPALSYQEIQAYIEQGCNIIVFYDTLEGVGNHSLVYSINDQEICFYDNFDAMPKAVFEQQRLAEGICQQAIVIYPDIPAVRYC